MTDFFNRKTILRIKWQNCQKAARRRIKCVKDIRVSAQIVLFVRAGDFPDNYHRRVALYKRRLSSLTGTRTVVSKINRVRIKSELLVLKRAAKQNLKIVLKSFFPCHLKTSSIFNLFLVYKLVGEQLRGLYKLETGFLPSLEANSSVIELRLVNPDLCTTFLQNKPLKANHRNYVTVIRIVHPDEEIVQFIKYRLKDLFI